MRCLAPQRRPAGEAPYHRAVAYLGVDVGGTFTDAVLLDDQGLRTAKVPTARRQEESVNVPPTSTPR